MPGCVMTMAFGWVPTHRDGLIIVVPYTCIFTGAVLLGGYFRHAVTEGDWLSARKLSLCRAGLSNPPQLSPSIFSRGFMVSLLWLGLFAENTTLQHQKHSHNKIFIFMSLNQIPSKISSFYAVNRCPSYICFVVLGIRLQQKDSSWKN